MSELTALTSAQEDTYQRLFNGRRPLQDPQRNQVVRKALAAQFPGVKFAVRNGYGANAKILWTDGPSDRAVRDAGDNALAGFCDKYGQRTGVVTGRSPSLEAAVASLVESWHKGAWFYHPNGVLSFGYQTEPHRADEKPYTADERKFYAAVSVAAGVTDDQWNAAVAHDRKRRSQRDSMFKQCPELYRTLADTLMELGEALEAAATT
jgi:hypothetical protein